MADDEWTEVPKRSRKKSKQAPAPQVGQPTYGQASGRPKSVTKSASVDGGTRGKATAAVHRPVARNSVAGRPAQFSQNNQNNNPQNNRGRGPTTGHNASDPAPPPLIKQNGFSAAVAKLTPTVNGSTPAATNQSLKDIVRTSVDGISENNNVPKSEITNGGVLINGDRDSPSSLLEEDPSEFLSAKTNDDSSSSSSNQSKASSKKSKKAELNSKALGNEMDVFTAVAEEPADDKAAAEEKPVEVAPAAVVAETNHKPEQQLAAATDSVLSSSTSSLTSTDTLPSLVNNVTAAAKSAVKAATPEEFPPMTNHVKSEQQEQSIAVDTPAVEAAPAEAVKSAETPVPSKAVEDPAPTNNSDDSNNQLATANGTAPPPAESQVKLKYDKYYRPGIWSPFNQDGKRQYDREFLVELSNDPKSKIKPENLPPMDIIKDKPVPNKVSSMGLKTADFTPSFIKGVGGRAIGPGSITKTRSREGKKFQPNALPQKPSMVISIPERQPQLHVAENAWKPGAKAKGGTAEVDPLEEVSKQVLAILNKLTPQKFEKLIQRFNQIEINTEAKLKRSMELIFEKAVDEPGFSEEYAKMCKVLNEKQVKENGQVVNFRKLLITRCQVEFEKDYMEGLDKNTYKQQLALADTEEKKKELQEDFEFKERKARRRSAGNTRFIGELYKLEMLTVRIMHECIRGLLKKAPDEESLECLCKLITTVGKVLEEGTTNRLNATAQGQAERQAEIVPLDGYFNTMQRIIDQKQTSTRVRCLLMDLIDLKRNKWVPRRKVAGPKTLEQIHKDLQKDKEKEQLETFVYQSQGSSKSLGGRDNYQGGGRSQDGRKKSNRFAQDEGGWSVKPSHSHKSMNEKIDISKFSFGQQKGPEGTGFSMGRPQTFGMWGKGSGQGAKAMPPPAQVSHNNRFSMLDQSSATERSSSPHHDRRGMGPSRSVGGAMMGRGGSRDTGRQDALNTLRTQTWGRPNGPGAFDRSGGGLNLGGPSSYQSNHQKQQPLSSILVVGPSEEEISANQHRVLAGELYKVKDKEERETKMKNRLRNIFEEFHNQPNLDNALLEVKESFKSDTMAWCVEEWVNLVLEKKAGTRKSLGHLLVNLVSNKLLQRAQVVQGIGNILEFAEEMICDIPKIWEFLGELIVPLLESRMFSMHFLRETAKRMNEGEPSPSGGKYVESVLRQLVEKITQIKVTEMWIEAELDWSLFLPSDQIADFVTKHHLEYTRQASSGSSSSNSHADPAKMTPEQRKETMTNLMEKTSAPHEEVIDFVRMYLDSLKGAEPDNGFIRMVTTAVTRSCLQVSKQDNRDPSQPPSHCKFLQQPFEDRSSILKILLDGKPNRELQALYAEQALMCELEYPSKMLQEIFETMHSNDLISSDSFVAWEKCSDPAEQRGKGVAMKSTIQFFTMMIHEQDEESNEDSDADADN